MSTKQFMFRFTVYALVYILAMHQIKECMAYSAGGPIYPSFFAWCAFLFALPYGPIGIAVVKEFDTLDSLFTGKAYLSYAYCVLAYFAITYHLDHVADHGGGFSDPMYTVMIVGYLYLLIIGSCRSYRCMAEGVIMFNELSNRNVQRSMFFEDGSGKRLFLTADLAGVQELERAGIRKSTNQDYKHNGAFYLEAPNGKRKLIPIDEIDFLQSKGWRPSTDQDSPE